MLQRHASRSKGTTLKRVLTCSAAKPKYDFHRIWPTFIRDGTPSGFKNYTSTGVPSAKYGISCLELKFEI